MIDFATTHLAHPCPEFNEGLDRLARTGQCFMLDGKPHLLSAKGTQLLAFQSYDKLAASLLCNGDVQIVNAVTGQIVPNKRQFVQDLARNLEAVLERNPGRWPTLNGYVRGPLFRRTEEGRLVRVKEGYDPDSGQLVLAPDWPDLPAPATGYPHLHELFSGLEFADPIYHANLLGVCVAMFCRTGMKEFPLLMIDATAKSSGKTTVLTTMAQLMNGFVNDASMNYTGNEQEFEVRVGSFCGLPGPNFIPIDNIRLKKSGGYAIRSQVLSSAVHSHVIKVRKLYNGPSLLFDPIFVGTMNNARVERDLADKTIVLTLTRPPGPLNHRAILPYPPDYVRQNRMEILAEILQVIDRLVLPPIDRQAQLHSRFYTFEQIVVGAARELEMEASLDPTRVRSVDAFLEQLLNLVYDTMPELAAEGAVPVERIVQAIESNIGFEELNDVLRSSPRAKQGKTTAFCDHLAATVSGKRYRWQGKVIGLTIDGDMLRLYNHE